MHNAALALVVAGSALCAASLAHAQDEGAAAAAYMEATIDVCVAAVSNAVAVEPNAGFGALDAQARAGHPFGAEERLWSYRSGGVTVRAPDTRTCSVFAVGIDPVAAFEPVASSLLRAGFEERQMRARNDGRVQRTFRNDAGVRIELEGFTQPANGSPADRLAMAHVGKR